MQMKLCLYSILLVLISIQTGCTGRRQSTSINLSSIQDGAVDQSDPLNILAASVPVSVSASQMGYAGSVVQIDTLPVGNQFAPKLAISYSSSMSEVGIAGLGWSLAGTNVISRCASYKIFDGVSKPVDWSVNDAWCMDGKKLLLVSGVAGTDGAEYRLFLDDNSKIVFKSGYFEVLKKSGERLIFGETDASREAGLNGSWFSYHLNKLVDLSGNAIDYSYIKDGARLFLGEVRYGGNVDFKRPHYRRVSFRYEAPAVSVIRYVAGQKFQADRLLKAIEVASDNKVAWTYRLHHERKTQAALPLLMSIDQCFADLNCTGKSSFQYSYDESIKVDESPALEWLKYSAKLNPAWALDYSGRHLIDLNHDGFEDLLGIRSDSISYTLSGPAGPGEEIREARTDFKIWSPLADSMTFTDFNRDGYADILIMTRYGPAPGVYVAFWNGRGFDQLKQISNYFGTGWSIDTQYRQVVDVNGDGWPDVIGSGTDGVFVAFNDQHGGLTGGDTPVSTVFTTRKGWLSRDTPRLFVDINGDGLVDIVGFGSKEILVQLGTGSGFGPPEVWSTDFGIDKYRPGNMPRQLADMNGDGLPDLVGMGYKGVEVALNTGTKFAASQPWLNNLGFNQGWDIYQKERLILDINKDGYPDLIGIKKEGVDIYLGNGIPNPGQQPIKTPKFSFRMYSWANQDQTMQVEDVNGNGKLDLLLYLYEGTWRAEINANPVRLTGVKTTLGEETQITYKKLTDPSVYTLSRQQFDARIPVAGAFDVVAEIKKSNGIGGFFSTRYAYENALYDGDYAGFLGFEKRRITDDTAGTEATETYSQDLKGMTQGILMSHHIDLIRNGQRVPISHGSNTVQAVALGLNPMHRAVIEKSSLTNFYDEEGRETYSVAVSKEFDEYQNARTVTTFIKDSRGTYTTRAESQFRNDPERWVLGLPLRVTTTSTSSTATGQSAVKTSSFEYDVAGLLTAETMEPDSPLWIRKEYPRTQNQYGLVDSVVTSWGPAHAKGLDFNSISSSQEFDSLGFVKETKNALGHQKSQTIDPDTGLTLSTTDENGLVTSVRYDAASRPISFEYPDGQKVAIERLMCDASCVPGAVMYKRQSSNRDGTSLAYIDSLGRTIRSVQSLTAEQNVAKDQVYDERGLLVRESKPFFLNDGPSQWITYGYDVRNRQTLVSMPDGSRNQILHNGLTRTGIDALGRRTVSVQDGRGLLQTMTNAKGEVLGYSYDASGQLVTLKDAGGNITRMEYDIYGRRTLLDDPSTGVTTSVYNALSLVAEQTRQGGKTINNYDALGRTKATERSAPGTLTLSERYSYDNAPNGIGQLGSAQGPGSSISLSYDALSRPSESRETLLGKTYVRRSNYDALGRVQSKIYPGGLTIAYDYDAVGQLKTIRDQQSHKAYWKLEALYPNGEVKEYTLGNGSRGIREQDQRTDRVVGESVLAPDQTLQMARTYDHDIVGNLKSRTDGVTGKTEAFSYDPLDRLETFMGPAFKTVTMRYDQLSRITERSDVGTYEYGPSCAGSLNSPFAPKKIGGKSFCTDSRGNVISSADRVLSYDANNLPVEMREGNRSVRYTYGLGKAVLAKDETIDGEKTFTRFAGEDYETIETGGSIKQRSYVGDFLVIETEGSDFRENYLYKDYLGSTLATADQNAATLERMDYDPFGQRRNVEDLNWLEPGTFHAKTTNRGFTGHDQIDSMNLVHMKGRVYDPTIALFLTPDPYIQDPTLVQSLNRYSYVVNNPLRYTDPTGHFFTDHLFREIGRGLASAGKALSNPGRFVEQTWNKLGRGASDARYQRLAVSIAISVVATVNCPFGADAAWQQTAAYYAAVGATTSYVASNGDAKAALNGAFTGAAFNMVGSYFDYLKESNQLAGSSLMAAKIVAHGVVGGLSAQSQGGSFESGFLSSGLSQAAGQFRVYEQLGASDNAQGWGIAYNAGVAAVVGGSVSSATGGSFEQGALNAAIGRLFNDLHHVRDPGSEVAQVWDDGISSKNGQGQCIPYADGSTFLGVTNVQGDGLAPDYTIENVFAIQSLARVGISLGLSLLPTEITYVYSARVLLREAGDPGAYHNFGKFIESQVLNSGERTVVANYFKSIKANLSANSVQYRLPGILNGRSGTFEVFTRPSVTGKTEMIMHRLFKPN